MLKNKRFFEADNGVTVPQAVEATPPAIVHVATEVPAIAKTGGESVVAIPHEAIHDTLKGLTTATEALTLAANKLSESASRATHEVVAPAIEAPIEKAADISPEIVPPPKERFVRRNGRKVKR